MRLYRIKDWAKHYEVSDSKKVDGPLTWVAVRTKQDGFGFRRLAQERDRCELLAAWILMVEIAARQRREERGKLVRDGRALTARSLATMTGFPESVFIRALEFFSEPEQDWLFTEVIPEQSAPTAASARAEGAPGGSPLIPAESDSGRNDSEISEQSGRTGQDRTGQDNSGASPPSAEALPPPARGASGELPLGVPPTPPIEVPFAVIIALFHDTCPALPRVTALSEARRRAIRGRFLAAKGDHAWFRTLFEKAQASDFISGRRPGRMTFGIDWLMNPTNAQKVIEGNYDNRAGGDGEALGKRSSFAE